MSGIDPSLFAATEQKYNLPPGILAATAQVESSGNPRAVSPQGAEGLMQLLPSTAKNLGADPYNVPQAVDAAGRLWAENLKAAGGDIDRAAMMYHGGPDTSKWGPKTQAYPAKLAAALGPSQAPAPAQEGGDPVEAALEGKPVQPQASAPAAADPSDPIESALAGNTQGTADLQAVNATLRQMFHAGKSTDDIIAYGVQHGVNPNREQIETARQKGMDVQFVQPQDQQAQPAAPQTSEGLGFLQGVARPIDNAALWLEHAADKIGLAKPLNEAASALGMAPSAEAANANQQAYFAQREAQGETPGKLGEFAGEVAGTIPAAFATKNPFIAGGVSGALTTDQPNDAKRVALDALIGALTGKTAHAATGAVASAVSPTVSKAVQALGDAGVSLTPGQIMGGALRRVEDAVTSIPFIGDVVKNAQRRSVLSLNTSVINDRVLNPIGQKLPDGLTGREAVGKADELVSDAYNKLLPQLNVQADHQFVQNAGSILQRADELPADRATQVKNIIKNSLVGKFDGAGQMSGTTFQKGDAKLGQLARMYSSSPDPEQREMGGIFRDMQSEFRDLLERSNPTRQGELQPIRQAFANLVRVEGAAGSLGAKEGIFTGPQLAASVKRYDASSRKNAYATGKALLQDISDPASSVLPSTLPDSGTPYRTIGAYLLGGGAAHASPVAALGVAPLGLYTKTGQKAFQKIMLAPRTPAEKALAKALTQLKAPFAVAGGAAGAEAANGY